MAFCKFRVMDRCTKSQQPCLFNEECFEPQDEPIPMACIKMSGAILQGPADGCLVDVGEFGLLMADIKEESLVNAIYDEMQRRGVREAYIVSPDFVRDAIREKLDRERGRREETAEKARDHGGAMEDQMF